MNFHFYRQSLVHQLTEGGMHHLPAHMPEKFKQMTIGGVPHLDRQATITDFEMTSLAPRVEGRIRKLDPQVCVSRKNQGSSTSLI